MPGTGNTFEIELRIEATVDEGQIRRWVSSYDVEDWQQQVGLAGVA